MALTKDNNGSWVWSGPNIFVRANRGVMSVGFNKSMLGDRAHTMLSSVTGVQKSDHRVVDMDKIAARAKSTSQEVSPRPHFPKRSQSRNLPG